MDDRMVQYLGSMTYSYPFLISYFIIYEICVELADR
jgi:hypothetical protein